MKVWIMECLIASLVVVGATNGVDADVKTGRRHAQSALESTDLDGHVELAVRLLRFGNSTNVLNEAYCYVVFSRVAPCEGVAYGPVVKGGELIGKMRLSWARYEQGSSAWYSVHWSDGRKTTQLDSGAPPPYEELIIFETKEAFEKFSRRRSTSQVRKQSRDRKESNIDCCSSYKYVEGVRMILSSMYSHIPLDQENFAFMPIVGASR